MRRALAAALVTAVMVGGCGGGGGGGAGKDDFIAQADQVCAAGNKALATFDARMAEAQRGADPSEVFPALATVTREAAAASQPFLLRLDALKTPNDDRDELKAWVADRRRQQSLLDELADAFEQQDEGTIATLSQRVDALNEKGNAFARKYGMAECAKGEA